MRSRSGIVAALVAFGCGAQTSPESSDAGDGVCTPALADSLTADGLREHLAALSELAAEHGGNRAAGTAGYDASLDYVEGRLEAAGYAVSRRAFEYPEYVFYGPSALEQRAPEPVVYAEGVDFFAARFSGAGDVTAPARAVDIALDDPTASTSGCEPEDFDALLPGEIAVVQRGRCYFRDKAENAQAAGAVAVVIFNADAEDPDAFPSSLGSSADVDIPVVITSLPIGQAFVAAEALTLRVAVDGATETRTSHNLVAERDVGDPDDVIMLGAHLDSVPEGAGINDNGSGSALVLALAEGLAACASTRRLRFAWWGAEELGLWGSTRYVGSLDDDARARLTAYLNFDMVASPNHVRYVYDGSPDGGAPPGSEVIEARLREAFMAIDDAPVASTGLGGRSDYWAFQEAGVPVGGLFTGAEALKTEAQAADYGGEVGAPLDPCYHSACDDLDNVDVDALLLMARVAADAVTQLAGDDAPLVLAPEG
ncbi:MAG: M28 family peptidase [Myxococcales bacterium]|nr:M28 family peptidase [Myxococcales bacterium]